MGYKFTRTEPTTVEEIGLMVRRAKGLWLKGAIAFLYVFGCRVSELLALRRSHFRWDNEYLHVSIPILKQRRTQGPYSSTRHELRVKRDTPFVNDILIPYVEKFEPDKMLWPTTRQRVWRKMKKLNKNLSPHVLRHDRLMKLALKGATVPQLMDWAGWSDPRPASAYIRQTGRLASQLSDLVE